MGRRLAGSGKNPGNWGASEGNLGGKAGQLQGQGRRRMCMWQQVKKINKTCEDAAVLLFATFTFATRRRLLAGQAASDVALHPR